MKIRILLGFIFGVTFIGDVTLAADELARVDEQRAEFSSSVAALPSDDDIASSFRIDKRSSDDSGVGDLPEANENSSAYSGSLDVEESGGNGFKMTPRLPEESGLIGRQDVEETQLDGTPCCKKIEASNNILDESEQLPQPLSQYQVFLVWIGVVGFALSLGQLLLTWWFRKKDSEASVCDSFWFREVIFPRVIEPLENKLLKNELRGVDLHSASEDSIDKLSKDLDELKNEIHILSLIAERLLENVETELDEVLLKVSTIVAPGEVYEYEQEVSQSGEELFTVCYLDILRLLIKEQGKLSFRKLSTNL